MQKICFKLVLNRENNLNANSTAMVEIEAKLLSNKIYLPTNVFLKPKHWNFRKQEVMPSHPNHELLNRFLEEHLLKLEWKELQMWKNNTPLTLEQLINTDIENTNINDGAFIDFCKGYINTSRKRDSTKKESYDNCKTHKHI